MSLLNCLKYGYSYSQSFFTRGNVLYVRQYHLIQCGTVKLLQDTCANQYGLVRCKATRSRAKIRQKPRTAEDDKKLKSRGSFRKFFMYTVPMVIAMTIVTALIVLAFGMLQSVKDMARSYYKGTPTDLYNKALDKCSQDSKLAEVLGKPIKEFTVNGEKEKVKLTRKQEGNTLVIKMQFNIEGPNDKGAVDMKITKTDDEDFKFEYLLVTPDKDQTITIEDNR